MRHPTFPMFLHEHNQHRRSAHMYTAKNPLPLLPQHSTNRMHRFIERKEILEKEIFKKGAINGQPTAESLSCIHNNHEKPNFVETNQACAHCHQPSESSAAFCSTSHKIMWPPGTLGHGWSSAAGPRLSDGLIAADILQQTARPLSYGVQRNISVVEPPPPPLRHAPQAIA